MIDRTAFEDRYEMIYSLSDGPGNITYSRFVLGDNDEILGEIPLKTVNGKASEYFYVTPGRTLNQRILVRAERKTRLGNQEIFTGTYNISVQNKKRFQ